MHPQVDGHQEDVSGKDVHLFGPASDSGVAAGAQLGVEKCVERVDRGHARTFAALHQQVHVKVDDLGRQRKESGSIYIHI